MQLTRRGAGALALAAVLALPAPQRARADAASGTWTGFVELLGSYYWEPSTKVAAPEISARLDAPSGLRIDGHYLVDAITSASQATGVQVDRAFTEVRHEGALGLGGEIDLGEVQVDLRVGARYSHEPDYRAHAVSASSAWFLAQRATTLRLDLSYFHDRVGRVLRFADEAPAGGPGGMLERWPGTIDGVTASAGIEQVVDPHLVLGLRYDFARLEGFLSNPYRKYLVDGQPLPENHPGLRLRHAVRANALATIPGTDTAVHAFVSVYGDDWDILALAPELRVYQRVADVAILRVRYEHYRQTAAFFDGDDGVYERPPVHGTNDPKMTAFHEHEVGVMLKLRLPFLERLAWDAVTALAFDYIWRTNRFGDGFVAQASVRLPF